MDGGMQRRVEEQPAARVMRKARRVFWFVRKLLMSIAECRVVRSEDCTCGEPIVVMKIAAGKRKECAGANITTSYTPTHRQQVMIARQSMGCWDQGKVQSTKLKTVEAFHELIEGGFRSSR